MSRFTNQPTSSRDALFGNNGAAYTPLNQQNPNTKLVSWNDDEDDDDEDDQFVTGRGRGGGAPSVQLMRHEQQNIIQEQDKNLEALSEVISRQKNLAQVIGNEVTYQNDLIDDITDHVDRTRDRLVDNTSRVRTIDRKDNTCRYWVIIVILLIVIIIVVSV